MKQRQQKDQIRRASNGTDKVTLASYHQKTHACDAAEIAVVAGLYWSCSAKHADRPMRAHEYDRTRMAPSMHPCNCSFTSRGCGSRAATLGVSDRLGWPCTRSSTAQLMQHVPPFLMQLVSILNGQPDASPRCQLGSLEMQPRPCRVTQMPYLRACWSLSSACCTSPLVMNLAPARDAFSFALLYSSSVIRLLLTCSNEMHTVSGQYTMAWHSTVQCRAGQPCSLLLGLIVLLLSDQAVADLQ